VQRVVDVVEPLPVEPVAPDLGDAHEPRVGQLALGDDVRAAAEPLGLAVDRGRQLLEQVDRRGVDDRVHGVQPEPVDVEVADPARRVLDRVPADGVAVGAVDVDRLAPRGVVPVGQVRPEVGEVVALGPVVVVDDVEDDPDAGRVRRVHQAAQARRPAVAVLRGVGQDPVVAPVALARELPDRHQLDRGDPEVGQLGQPRDDRVEGALGVKVPTCSS
jgi:hypothetical protein